MSGAAAVAVSRAPVSQPGGRPGGLEPARTYPEQRDGVRLLVIDPAGALSLTRMDRLSSVLARGDLLVLNDAATLPASLQGHDERGRALEVRLCGQLGPGRFQAVLFGAGSWRLRTEDRPPPPPLSVGARLALGPLSATVVAVSDLSPRLCELRFEAADAALWSALYAHGRPVQYSHLSHELPLWAVQNVYAGPPAAFEMPSAGRALSWRILLEARRRGIELAWVTHAAGLSASGDPALDAALPLPERFEIPAVSAAAVSAARERGGRIIAVGTTVVRALEGAHRLWGELHAGSGITDLRLDARHRLQVVDGLLSGLHDPVESHFRLLSAFTSEHTLRRAHALAASEGLRSHELGDAQLILRGQLSGCS